MIVSEVKVTQEWRNRIAEWLVKGGCLYVVAWGAECEDWHIAADMARLEEFNFGDVPNDKFVMTTSHENEPLEEAFWFAGQCAFHPDVELRDTIILHIADEARGAEMQEIYSDSQKTTPTN